jgi:hypothetical protein
VVFISNELNRQYPPFTELIHFQVIHTILTFTTGYRTVSKQVRCYPAPMVKAGEKNMKLTLKNTCFRRLMTTGLLAYALWVQSVPVWAYQIDQSKHIITVSPTGDYTTDARKALTYLLQRPDKETLWTLRFNPGKYYMSRPLYGVGLKNVQFVSSPDNPAMLIKGGQFTESEYLIYLRMSEKIGVRGFQFYGRTLFKTNNNPVWPDQGLFFGSCRNVTIDRNHFYNFGNAALRVTTSESDPVKGVNSFDTNVTDNTFNNIYQISTTSNDDAHGATARYWLKNNTIANLKGSIKFASRTSGAQDVHIMNNNINGSEHYGLEIDNFDNLEIVGNTLQNIKGIAINIYTNPRVNKGFNWGNNFNISDNQIHNVRRAIRFSPDPSADGYKPVPKNLKIVNNTLTEITESDPHVSAISVVNGVVNGVKITDNKMSSVKNRKFITISKGSNPITQINNTGEGNALGSQSVGGEQPTGNSPSTPSTSALKAPSHLIAKYDGQLTIKLNWNDNAQDETALEVWGSFDNQKFDKVAQVYKDTQVFTHRLRQKPAKPNYYYQVRALKDNVASPMSNVAKISFQ